MAITQILTARAVYGVLSREELAARHAEALARHRARGLAVVESEAPERVVARVDHGRWIVDCACGSGAAVDPLWPEARCFECGTVYRDLQWPVDRQVIERILLQRSVLKTRNWFAHEHPGVLVLENEVHGVPVPSGLPQYVLDAAARLRAVSADLARVRDGLLGGRH